jgi:hypothetical protein
VLQLKANGNDAARATWLARAPPVGQGGRPKEGESLDVFKSFVVDVYERKKYYTDGEAPVQQQHVPPQPQQQKTPLQQRLQASVAAPPVAVAVDLLDFGSFEITAVAAPTSSAAVFTSDFGSPPPFDPFDTSSPAAATTYPAASVPANNNNWAPSFSAAPTPALSDSIASFASPATFDPFQNGDFSTAGQTQTKKPVMNSSIMMNNGNAGNTISSMSMGSGNSNGMMGGGFGGGGNSMMMMNGNNNGMMGGGMNGSIGGMMPNAGFTPQQQQMQMRMMQQQQYNNGGFNMMAGYGSIKNSNVMMMNNNGMMGAGANSPSAITGAVNTMNPTMMTTTTTMMINGSSMMGGVNSGMGMHTSQQQSTMMMSNNHPITGSNSIANNFSGQQTKSNKHDPFASLGV